MSSTEPLQPGYGTCDGLSPQCPVEATIYGYVPHPHSPLTPYQADTPSQYQC